LKAEPSFTGINISGPGTQLSRLKEDLDAHQAKKEAK
jgi:hypothetical protein